MRFPRILLAALGAAILLPSALAQSCPVGQREHKDDNGKLWCVGSDGKNYAAPIPSPPQGPSLVFKPGEYVAGAEQEVESKPSRPLRIVELPPLQCGDSYSENRKALESMDGSYKLASDALFTKRDYALARCWAEIGEEQGDRRALTLLGFIYSKPEFSGHDPELAFRYVKQAADKGDPGGEYLLSLAYERGIGTPRDDTSAGFWRGEALKTEEGRAIDAHVRQQAAVREQNRAQGLWFLLNLFSGGPMDENEEKDEHYRQIEGGAVGSACNSSGECITRVPLSASHQ